MGIHWSLPLLKKHLPDELWNRLPEAQNDPNYVTSEDDVFKIFNSGTGDILKTLPALGSRRFSRRKLRALLTDGLDVKVTNSVIYKKSEANHLKYGKTLQSLTYEDDGVIAHFTDSTSSTGSLVLGCDGPASAVRSILVGPEAAETNPLEITHSLMHVCYNDAAKARQVRGIAPVFAFAVAPSNVCNFITIQDAAQADRPETWVFLLVVVKAGWPDKSLNDTGRLRVIKEQCAELVEPVRTTSPVEFRRILKR